MTKKQRTRLDTIAKRVDRLLSARTRNAVELGKQLNAGRIECEKTGEEFLLWLSERFDLSQSTAYNYMNAADYVKRFPTVVNAKLAPTVLYALANGDYDESVAARIRRVARTEHVGPDRARQIELKWQSEQSLGDGSEPEAQQPDAPQPDEIDEALAKPPDVPPPPEPAPPENLLLPIFDDTIGKLKKLITKQPATFADTSYSADDLQNYAEQFADLLRAIANLVRKIKEAA